MQDLTPLFRSAYETMSRAHNPNGDGKAAARISATLRLSIASD